MEPPIRQVAITSDDSGAALEDDLYPRGVSDGSRGLTQQTLAGLIWQFGGAAIELAVRITVMIVLARLLEPEEFGVASAATVVLSVAQIFAQLGVGQAIVHRPRLTARDVKSAFALSVWSSLAAAAVIVLSAPSIAQLFRMPRLEPVVALLSVAFLLTGPAIVAAALTQRRRRYRMIAAVDAASFIFGYAAVGVSLALLQFGLWSLIFAQISQTLIRSLAYLRLQPHVKGLTASRSSLRALLDTGTGYSLGQIGNFLALNGDNFAVGRWMGAMSLGFYSRAYQFLSIPSNLFGTVVDKVLFPAMAQVQNEPDRLSRAYRRSLAAIAMITLPASAVMVILAPELVGVVLGSKWASTTAPFQILAATLMFRTSYKISDSLARATGAVYRRAWRQWVYAFLVIVGAAAGSRWGLAGVAVGVGAAIVANFAMMMHLAIQLAPVSWGAVARLHGRQLLAATPLAIAAQLSVHLARSQGLSAPTVLGLGLVVAGGVWGLTILLARPLLGPEGQWLIKLAWGRLEGVMSRLRARASIG